MIQLPYWHMTNSKPAFFDSDSATAIEQTAKLYAAMQDLINEYNKFAETVNTHISKLDKDTDEAMTLFSLDIRQEFQDFIDVIYLKTKTQDKYIKESLQDELIKFISNWRDSGELTKDIEVALNDIILKIEDEASLRAESDSYIQNNLSKEITSRKTADLQLENAIKSLTSRMDSFTSLESGSTTGDAELIDLRTDYKGNVHESAGTSVRTQIQGLATNIRDDAQTLYDMFEYSENRMYWSDENVTKDFYLENDGTITPYVDWWITDYLAVESGTEYVYIKNWAQQTLADNVYYHLFDVNKNFISGANGEVITTTDDTAYIRVSLKNSYFNGGCTIIKKSLYEAGLSSFIPYYKRLKSELIPKDSDVEELSIAVEEVNSDIEAINSNLDGLNNFATDTTKKLSIIEEYSQPNYDKTMRSIQRIGEVGGVPHHSELAFITAYKMGFRILLCDLRFTSDNVPVLFHDDYINHHYTDVYDSEGNPVSKELQIFINQHTYEELSQYDYGRYISTDFAGYPLMTLSDMLKLVKKLGVELYIEVKAMTEAQSKIACDLVRSYGLTEVTSWAGEVEQMRYVISHIDTARVSTMPSELTDEVLNDIESLKTGKNKVFAFGWNTTILTSEIVQKMIEKDIAFEHGTINTEAGILDYMNQGEAYQYCTGIESNTIIAGKTILENALS